MHKIRTTKYQITESDLDTLLLLLAHELPDVMSIMYLKCHIHLEFDADINKWIATIFPVE